VKILRNFLDQQKRHFEKDGKLSKLHPLFEATESFLFSTGEVTGTASHVRDAMDLKRMMITVVVAAVPTLLMALYNTGLQANLVLVRLGEGSVEGWRGTVITMLGTGSDPGSLVSNIAYGALCFFPLYFVSVAVGGFWEVLFAVVRKHEINEGFLVTSFLFPLILPPDLPLWQVALGISFGVVIGKEVFGGVGMNILNPALTGRVFLLFAYPAEITGDSVWIAVDGVSKATPLAQLADPALNMTISWWNAFLGLMPGSIGETSTLACLIGAVILIVTGVGSWRVMASILVGMVSLSLLFNLIGSETNHMFQVSPLWHLVLGGFAFGTVYMATDPVTSAMTDQGKIVYGLLIGFLVILIRVINPAFAEGMTLAILFGNVFAPIIDRIFINKNIKRRLAKDVS
jgi:Na+-transporting NADH:ubiquinone oxidoreductase subunit B